MKNRLLLISTYEDNIRSFIKPQGGQVFIKKYLELYNEDIEINIIDPQIDDKKLVREYLKRNYDYYGFYCTFPTILNTIELMKNAYKYNPDAILILGGPGAVYTEIFQISPVDIVISGEGEKVISNLLAILKTKDDIASHISQLEYLDGDYKIRYRKDGKIYFFEKKSTSYTYLCREKDLDEIIPLADWEINLHQKYINWTSIMLDHNYGFPIFLSRGCTSIGCKFCSSYNWFKSTKGVRVCSAQVAYNLIKDINNKMPYIKEILFEDDNFFADESWLNKFVSLISEGINKKELRSNYRFIIKCRLEVLTEEWIEKLINIGVSQFNIGVESCSKKVLYEINKTYDANNYIKKINNIFEWKKKYNVDFHCYMIFFTPKTELEDFLKSVEMATQFIINGIEISCYDSLLAFPGSKYEEEWEKNHDFVNWIEIKNPMYEKEDHSESDLFLGDFGLLPKYIELPINFRVKDQFIAQIYEKSKRKYNDIYNYFSKKMKWKTNTSYRIAVVKLYSYICILLSEKINCEIKQKLENLESQIVKLINISGDRIVENMSCYKNDISNVK